MPDEPDDEALFAELSEDDAAEESEEDEPPAARRPAGGKTARQKPKPARSSSSSWVKWLLILGGSGLALLLLCCGGGYFWVSSMLKPPAPSAQASEPFPVEALRAPAFPELGQPQTIGETGVQLYALDLSSANAGNTQPAARMQLRVYLPPGEHAAGSLGCVLVAPAGTNLLTGNALDDPTYHVETLPYAQNGYVAVLYSLDGGLPEGSDGSADDDLARAYSGFSAAYAGLANARAALEFVLARLPQVDRRRIFAAGHSSAGTLALLFAEHERRLKGCIAYAPATDVDERLGLMLALLVASQKFPGVVDFVHRSSPQTHLARIQCPVFLFWADDDSVVAPEGIKRFATALGKVRQDVTVKTVPGGDHYDSMVNPGIGMGIEWIKKLPGEQAVAKPDEDGEAAENRPDE